MKNGVAWEDVHFKRKRCADEKRQGDLSELRRTSPPLGTRQDSPPYIRTPAGLVKVCGQCLKPCHMAADCRQAITCRVCGGIGHKGRDCRRRGSSHHQMTETTETRSSHALSATRPLQDDDHEVVWFHGGVLPKFESLPKGVTKPPGPSGCTHDPNNTTGNCPQPPKK
ncbi:hypothetical protein J5N97_009656 [Dioscorea zingiberensis]|uniref:CCHC-type domain-containing protein n=1 Tax=Dioscorea zingiberensis TaxID=325984 RepID=A0A9D5CXK4_9LILI|nr:hypothetical protein J5N97_009656 [Dioscorea zingiberensis]